MCCMSRNYSSPPRLAGYTFRGVHEDDMTGAHIYFKMATEGWQIGVILQLAVLYEENSLVPPHNKLCLL